MKAQNLLAITATVALISSATGSVTIDYVIIGNAGNTADPLTGFGAVDYEYKIGKYEVTNAQYGAFLNAAAKTDSYGLYNSEMSSYGITQSGSSGNYTYSVTTALANRPVVYVSWFDAARFANWMMNGQGNSNTENGAYTLNGATSGIILANAGAQVYIPTEDEWYKAAYYDSTNSSYWIYPNGSNSITAGDANYFNNGFFSSTDVGSYVDDASPVGTFDQGGNVFEWNDAVNSESKRGLRGGGWSHYEDLLASSTRVIYDPLDESNNVGFRLSSIPEPSSLIFGGITLLGCCLRRKR